MTGVMRRACVGAATRVRHEPLRVVAQVRLSHMPARLDEHLRPFTSPSSRGTALAGAAMWAILSQHRHVGAALLHLGKVSGCTQTLSQPPSARLSGGGHRLKGVHGDAIVGSVPRGVRVVVAVPVPVV